jgi:putative glutamine amidotransferase
MRPLIGVTAGDGGRKGHASIREDYLLSVEESGGAAVLLAPAPPARAKALVERLDGLLLSGGVDVDPGIYGQAPHARLGRVDRRRDDFEIALLRAALRRDLPVLAICRGQQVLNVALGGTLVQDIPSLVSGAAEHHVRTPRWRLSHAVAVTRGTRLHELVGRDTVAVNSIHHQSVDRVGQGLVVSARCPDDGVIEGVELPGSRFVVGVQWHPESFRTRPDSFRRLFEAHVDACRTGVLVGRDQ